MTTRYVHWRPPLRRARWPKVLAWSGLVVAAVAVVVAAVYVVFWPLSDVIARHDVAGIIPQHRAAALQAARDAARGRLVAFGAGLFAAGALIYTARNYSLSRQGQVTDRYTKAIEQLGSDKGLDVRIGAIYALERIARDSPRDHPTIMEVLAAFVREHSKVPSERETGHPDVLAAASVIGRRNPRHDRARLDLAFADLPAANLAGANLAGAFLAAANLRNANLRDVNLRDAHLGDANLRDAILGDANLRDAYLHRADLRAALFRADLRGATLSSANLENANLHDADLRDAHLRDANLHGADFHGADLTDAWWPAAPVAVPEGWQRIGGVGILQRVGKPGGDADSSGRGY